MFRILSSAALFASLTVVGCSSNPFTSAKTPTSSYDVQADELLAVANEDTWYPTCTAHVPAGSHCGMLVSTAWKARLDRVCHDAASCAKEWIDSTRARLEAVYGGSATQVARTCGSDCANPYVLELAMMKDHNQRVDAGYREALRALRSNERAAPYGVALRESESDRKDREAAYAQRVAGAFAAMSLPTASCRENAECPVGTCVLPAGGLQAGMCVR